MVLKSLFLTYYLLEHRRSKENVKYIISLYSWAPTQKGPLDLLPFNSRQCGCEAGVGVCSRALRNPVQTLCCFELFSYALTWLS